jgi:hypothetical protein
VLDITPTHHRDELLGYAHTLRVRGCFGAFTDAEAARQLLERMWAAVFAWSRKAWLLDAPFDGAGISTPQDC